MPIRNQRANETEVFKSKLTNVESRLLETIEKLLILKGLENVLVVDGQELMTKSAIESRKLLSQILLQLMTKNFIAIFPRYDGHNGYTIYKVV